MKNVTYTKELGHKDPRYLIMQHISRPRYIIHHNSHKSDNYFLSEPRITNLNIVFHSSQITIHVTFLKYNTFHLCCKIHILDFFFEYFLFPIQLNNEDLFRPVFFDMQHFSSPSYIIHHNSHMSDNCFYSTNAKTILRV